MAKRKRVVLIADIPRWAWDIKCKQLKRYLSDEFDIRILYYEYVEHKDMPSRADLYVTFTPSHLRKLTHIDRDRLITGVTGHPGVTRWFGRDYSKRVAALHANSLLLKQAIQLCHPRVYYVPNGVDTALFKPAEFKERKELIIGFVGKAHKEKGLDDVIRPACNMVTGVSLQTITKNWKEAKPQSDLMQFYHSIDVYVVASTMDGTPNPALEAAACGRPIVSNVIGNMPQFIRHGENGLLLLGRDKREYAKSFAYLRDNHEHLHRMGSEARRTAEKGWDWKVQAERYRKMFREVIG